MTRSRIVCFCGTKLREPLPSVCPGCGAKLTLVRRSRWRPAASLLLIVALAAACLAYGWWLLSTAS